MSVGFSQTFRLDLDLLAETIKLYIQEPGRHPDSVSETLGIGRRKLDGINGWLKQMRLRNPRKRQLSDLAKVIYSVDPALDLRSTHIILHYLLISNPAAEIWYGLFNALIRLNESFTRDDAITYFENQGITSSHLNSDVSNLLKMYSSDDTRAFADLNLINERDGQYSILPMQDIPPMILAYCLYDYRERHTTEATTSVERLLVEHERPGKVFGITEPDLRSALKAAEWEGLITIIKSADIDGITYVHQGEAIDLLRKHYNSK